MQRQASVNVNHRTLVDSVISAQKVITTTLCVKNVTCVMQEELMKESVMVLLGSVSVR